MAVALGAKYSLSHSQGWSGSSPEPDRVRGVSGYQHHSLTHIKLTREGRSSLGPGKGALGPSGYNIPKSVSDLSWSGLCPGPDRHHSV
eukprot:2445395-Pleurochrysis_carterae.AAC.2